MGVLKSFLPGGGMGNSPIKKIVWGFCPGGWSGLELTDTLWGVGGFRPRV